MEVASQSVVSIYLGNHKSYVGPIAREYPFSYELLYTICRSRVPMRAKLNGQETQQFRCVRGLSTDTCSCVRQGIFVLAHESEKTENKKETPVVEEITETVTKDEQSETYSSQPIEVSSEASSAASTSETDTTNQASRRGRRPSKKE